jgi:uncharacterized lipoprotein YddW (UPF0748 family)
MPARCRLAVLAAQLITLLWGTLAAQAPTTDPELRGCWIATVNNIDWPSRPGLSAERQRMEFDSMLNVLRATGINAVFVQVRPAADALYPSASAPWSRFLSGREGAPPTPLYDPLAYMIQAAHSRGMTFHAWLNPLRATTNLDTLALAPTHPLRALDPQKRKSWFFRYGQRYYFNPANAAVRHYIAMVVQDIVQRYDVDGIHFDDYFYPYKENGQTLPDKHLFDADPRGFTRIADWRRDNINRLIESVHTVIRTTNPSVQFGISPFGVWRNRENDPRGSDTRAGVTAYDDLYADVLTWLQQGWIDYVAPQIYWSTTYKPAAYIHLCQWWAANCYGKKVYIGHAAYKLGNAPASDPGWNDPAQLALQIRTLRNYEHICGSIFFSAQSLLKNPLGLQDSIRQLASETLQTIAGMGQKTLSPPAAPAIYHLEGDRHSIRVSWHTPHPGKDREIPRYYALYRFPASEPVNLADTRFRLYVSPPGQTACVYNDLTVAPKQRYTYIAVGYDHLHRAGPQSPPKTVKKTKKGIAL